MQSLKIDFSGALSDAVGEHGISASDLESVKEKIDSFSLNFPFMNLPGDSKTAEEILKISGETKNRFQSLVVLGIGGSALGLRAVARALLPPHYNMLDSKARRGHPKLFVCDNIDPDYFGSLLEMLDWKSTCVNVISKSGKTTETASQFYLVKELLIKKVGVKKWKDHVIVTTDPLNGLLRKMVREERLSSLEVPIDVGGRFSVLSSVGLFPAACVGVDIKAMLKGAADMAATCSTKDLEKNPALKNGTIHYLMDTEKKKPISVMMPYADSLSLIADWYAQLWAESLGKDGRGPTPVKALGVTDQHSQLQLYMEGPNDKVITVVGVDKFRSKLSIPKDLAADFSYIAGKDLGDVLRAEQKATAMALTKAKRPNITVTLPELSAYAIGQFFMMYQIQTAFAGHLYGVDAFNQPGVELGKRLTREILAT